MRSNNYLSLKGMKRERRREREGGERERERESESMREECLKNSDPSERLTAAV